MAGGIDYRLPILRSNRLPLKIPFVLSKFVGNSQILFIPGEIREIIKSRLVRMIGLLPSNLDIHIYTAVQEIAKYDYPEKWPSLLDVRLGQVWGLRGLLISFPSVILIRK